MLFRRLNFLLCVLAVLFMSVPVYAEPQFKFGFYERMRYEYWQNIFDMDNGMKDNRNYFRFKTSVWGQVDFDKNLSLFAKLTNEFKAYTEFEGSTSSVPDKSATKKGYHFDINEVVFDNLYTDVNNILNFPVDLRIGRQDFFGQYGEGFLIMDGTPQDFTRTFYFNAAKARWRADENNSLDFIYINDPRSEEFLPVINRKEFVQVSNPTLDKTPQPLNTTDEEGYVLYWKNKAVKNLALEGYYIYKREGWKGGTGMQGEKGIINTMGSFAKYNFSPFTLRTQLAFQLGSYGNQDRQALGGYLYLDREFKNVKYTPKFSLGAIYLSGDKLGSSKKGAWDPLFSRYYWISDIYSCSIAKDTGNNISGYWTNLEVWNAEFSLFPTKKSKLTLRYNFLRAPEKVASNAVCSGNGQDRGHLGQAKIEYTLSKNVTTYLLGEYFIPGNFYKDHDPAVFVRADVTMKF
ncbi:hypothetical protein EPN54_05940 [bacterium]|nr:MAG: hypothetical protein EPN54_05940 [bacterium]